MSITSPLTTDDASGAAKTVVRLSQNGSESRWIDPSTNLTEPVTLVIRHEVVGKGANIVDRHNLRFGQVEVDSAGTPRELTVNFTIGVPRSSAFSTADVQHLVMRMVNAITDQSQTGGYANWTTLGDLLIGLQ